MNFFKPEDFQSNLKGKWHVSAGLTNGEKTDFDCIDFDCISNDEASKQANAKLSREGKVVYGNPNNRFWDDHMPGEDHQETKDIYDHYGKTHKAFLINIEPIEKCTHPKEKVKQLPYKIDGAILAHYPVYLSAQLFECECGVRVEPLTYGEVNDSR